LDKGCARVRRYQLIRSFIQNVNCGLDLPCRPVIAQAGVTRLPRTPFRKILSTAALVASTPHELWPTG